MPNPRRRSGGRRRNPGMGNLLDFDRAMDVTPAATLGMMMGRWLTKFAGPFEAGVGGAPQPGVKHALALLIGSKIGSDLVDGFMPGKGHIAEIAALGFAGDLFLRKRFMMNSPWMMENLYLDGFEMESAIGQSSFVDATGQTYVMTPNGWALAGGVGQELTPGQIFTLPDGTVVQVEGEYEDGSDAMGGFEMESAIGGQYETGDAAMGYGGSSFGYR
jgi:hypothetical protein